MILRKNGMKYKSISKYYNGFISPQSISKRLEKYNETQNKHLAKIILNLVETRNATTEQIKTIADLYGINLGETLNSLEEER